ncbi:MAG: signal peptidase II, partial [Gammaproteobacteria bacterium]
ALSLILGGAMSNLLDRFWAGYVTDFIDFHINTWHFANFNIADSAISIGATILIILLIFKRD